MPDTPHAAVRRIPPPLVRALVLAGTWLPLLAFIAYRVPRFVPIFDKLAQRNELPESTQFLLSLVQLGPNETMLAGVVFLLVILVLDRAIVRSRLSTRFWWSWFVTVVFLIPIALFTFCIYALMAPVHLMGADVTP